LEEAEKEISHFSVNFPRLIKNAPILSVLFLQRSSESHVTMRAKKIFFLKAFFSEEGKLEIFFHD
jgi:hypothetical protein